MTARMVCALIVLIVSLLMCDYLSVVTWTHRLLQARLLYGY